MEFSDSDIVESTDTDADGGLLDQSAAYQAAVCGDVDTLVEAIKCDPSILETPDGEGLTPLGHAVIGQQLECMKILVKMGADVNAEDNFGRSVLSIVAYQGWYEGLIFLLRNGANQQTVDKAGRSPLHAGTYDTNVKIIKALLQTSSVEDVNLKDNEGMTALHWASFHNRPEYVQLLLRKGANSMSLDVDGKTALHWACQNGSVNCSRLLANCPKATKAVNCFDASGKTPIHFAAAAGHKAVIQVMAKIPDVDLEPDDPDDRTPLHWAAASGSVATVTALLDLGVNACPLDAERATPLDYAKQSGHIDCVKALEDSLGIHPVPETRRRPVSSGEHEKRSNLGLLSSLFKRKKNKKPPKVSDVSSENFETAPESSCDVSQISVPPTIAPEESKKQTRRKSKQNKVSAAPSVDSAHQSNATTEAGKLEDETLQPPIIKDWKSAEAIDSPSRKSPILSNEIKSKPILPLLSRSTGSVSPSDLANMSVRKNSLSPASFEMLSDKQTLNKLAMLGASPIKREISVSVGDIPSDSRQSRKIIITPPNTSHSNPEGGVLRREVLAPLRVPKTKLSPVKQQNPQNLKIAELRLDRGGINRTPTPSTWEQTPLNERRLKPLTHNSGIAGDVERYRALTGQTDTKQEPKKSTKKKGKRSKIPATDIILAGNENGVQRHISPNNGLPEFHEERRTLDKDLNSLLR